MTTLYTYIQTHYKDDPHTGDFYRHAPHQAPDGSSDLLSLACCAKVTRRVAEEDDWVMGLLSVNERPDDGRRKVSFLFRIDDIVARAKYYAHSKKRFDNYYRPNGKAAKATSTCCRTNTIISTLKKAGKMSGKTWRRTMCCSAGHFTCLSRTRGVFCLLIS
jgi:hypothetical protein